MDLVDKHESPYCASFPSVTLRKVFNRQFCHNSGKAGQSLIVYKRNTLPLSRLDDATKPNEWSTQSLDDENRSHVF